MARDLPAIIRDAQKSLGLTDDGVAAASSAHPSGGFTRQTLSAIRKGRPIKPETFEALMVALALDANEVRAELGWPQREVAEPFIHGVPYLDQLNRHYRTQVIRIGYEYYKAQRWSESHQEDADEPPSPA